MIGQLLTVRRLGAGDLGCAHQLFALMAAVFEEERHALSAAYVDALLARADFWALAAHDAAGELVGGLTAHVLPMTRAATSELFIYDIAVLAAHQRTGVGRALIEELRRAGAAAGITLAFVPAESDDQHALDFYRAVGGEPSAVTFFVFDLV